MGEKTGIEWTDSTWNPLRALNLATGKIGWHCEHASEGCRFCYAEGINRRLGTGLDFKPGHRGDVEIFLDEKMLLDPLHWKKPRMIFVNSMSDTFAEFVKDEWIDRMFAVMALCPQHKFQVLTKRAGRMRKWCTETYGEGFTARDRIDNTVLGWCLDKEKFREIFFRSGRLDVVNDGYNACEHWPLPNVWIGISAERQQEADDRIPSLLATPAAVRFVSLEPLLGPIDLFHIKEATGFTFNALSKKEGISFRGAGLDWIITGGESGPHARPMHPQWARDIRDQCAAAGVPYFFKQWGEWEIDSGRPGAMPENGARNTWVGKNGRTYNPSAPNGLDCWAMRRIGKRAAGRLLDGIEHNGMPT